MRSFVKMRRLLSPPQGVMLFRRDCPYLFHCSSFIVHVASLSPLYPFFSSFLTLGWIYGPLNDSCELWELCVPYVAADKKMSLTRLRWALLDIIQV